MKKPDWGGQTVVCIASGPSLTQADCDLVHDLGYIVIVTNTTFRRCPWADVLFAFDVKWWQKYNEEVSRVFKGRKLSFSQLVKPLGVESLFRVPWFNNFGNSGACAIELAIAGGASKVILLGYDCKVTDKTHWHGDHPAGMSNVTSIKRWPSQFRSVAKDAERQGVLVLNASRDTALKCFARVILGDVI